MGDIYRPDAPKPAHRGDGMAAVYVYNSCEARDAAKPQSRFRPLPASWIRPALWSRETSYESAKERDERTDFRRHDPVSPGMALARDGLATAGSVVRQCEVAVLSSNLQALLTKPVARCLKAR